MTPSPRPLRHSIPTPLRGFGLRPHPPHEAADLWDCATQRTVLCSVGCLMCALRGCKHPRSPAFGFLAASPLWAALRPAWAFGLRLSVPARAFGFGLRFWFVVCRAWDFLRLRHLLFCRNLRVMVEIILCRYWPRTWLYWAGGAGFWLRGIESPSCDR